LLVVGETARADHFGLNGYTRNTTPQLKALGDEVTSFGNVRSCGTNTAVSLPCMFSHLGRIAWNDREREHESLLHMLHRAGYAVLWLDNQSGCKGVCNGLPTVNTAVLKLPEHCASGECHDGVMLAVLDAEIAKLDPARRARGVVVAMHQMGSHGPAYFKRVPENFVQFTPECRTSNLQECSRENIVNSYDNTILYTDWLLGSSITWLKAKAQTHATALLYVSDHGESLGENNLYLHGLPYAIAPDTQKHVPMVTWFSDAFETRSGVSNACLRRKQAALLSHDNYFHTVAGLLDVKSAEYKVGLDAFAGC
jgi:lipid A ethanolaminephosphotransferase